MEDSLGILNINNATLRVGKLQVSDIQGVDTALNVTKSNSVLLYDDQHTATTFNGILGGNASRDTTNNYLNLTQGSVYWGIKLPNAWVMEFDINIRSGTNAGPLVVNAYSTTFTGAQGYSFIFDDSGDKITIKYGSTQLASQVVSGLFTGSNQFQKVAIHYERGRINISLDGVHKLYFTDVERSIPYTTGEFINLSSTSADLRQVKNFKITNSDKWTYSGDSNVVFTQGSVGIGTTDPNYTLDVDGDINFTGTFYKGGSVFVSSLWTDGTDSLYYRSNVEVGTGNLFVDTTTSNVGIRTTTPAYELDVSGNVNADWLIGNGSAIDSIQSANVTNFASNVSRITDLEENTMSIAGDKTFTGDVVLEANLVVHGNVLVANTQHLIVSDPIIELGANNQNTNDLGIVMSRHTHGSNDSNVAIIYDESAKELTFGYTLKNANSHTIAIQANDILTTNICGSLRTTSNLIVDTDTIYVDATNDRVGINKTPTTALDVSGIATFDNDLIVDTDTLHVDVSSDRVGINKLTPDANLHVVGNAYVSSNLMVDTDTLYVDATNGRVGVNKTPTTALDVSGIATFDDDLIVATDTLHVDVSSDRVGINKLTPDASLHVVGNTHISSNLTVVSNLTVDTNTLHVDVSSDRVGINKLIPDSSLHVEGNAYVSSDFSHGGLVPTPGTEIDQIKTFTSVSLSLTDAWTSTTITGTALATGSYIVQLFAHENAGGQNYNEYYTGFMSWYADTTNSTESNEIVLHAAGEKPSSNHTYLRVTRASSPGVLTLEIRKDIATGGAKDYTFKFRRMI